MIDPIYFGCDAKLDLKTLKQALGKINELKLSENHGVLSFSNKMFGTTDTVYQFCSDYRLFVEASYYHCANDLMSSKINPTDTFLNIGFPAGMDKRDISNIFEITDLFLNNNNINLINAHSYKSDTLCITWSLIGESTQELKPLLIDEEYLIIQVKKLGLSQTLREIELSRKTSQKDFYEKFKASAGKAVLNINKSLYCGSTDISGFGLYHNLDLMSKLLDRSIELYLNRVIYYEDLHTVIDDTIASCSVTQNYRDFEEDYEFTTMKKQILFGGEVNGPILIVVNEKESKTILKSLHHEIDAEIIGRITKESVPKVIIKE
jgi:thiamine monophosphate kinase